MIGAVNVIQNLVIRPVFYLNEKVESISGNGTTSSPYRLKKETYLVEKVLDSYGIISTVVKHDGSHKSDATVIDANDESYRFTGSSSIVETNYVCFDNNKSGTCDEDKTYRIIGLFKNSRGLYEAKLVKNTPYITESYSGSSSVTTNDWTQSTLNTEILNGDTFASTLNDYDSLITEHDYYIQGFNSNTITPKKIFDFEMNSSNPITYKMKFGLMYVSDWLFAASSSYWTYPAYASSGNSYKDASSSDWLFLANDWFISKATVVSTTVWFMDAWGTLDATGAKYAKNVRPVFYLVSNAKVKNGNGYSNTPYRIIH